MKEKNLRLRLVVRRHGLPEVRVVFNVPLDHDPTVAKLVELVNETIPLESGEWGLEDYVVELRDSEGHAFECLHFQPVTSILEKDDEVFIRPLFSEDIKKRRLSGRHQISSDGKHLIDGVAFGRQRLKTPRDRPAVHISPRKRRRLTYDEAISDPADDTSEDERGDEEDDDEEGDDEDYRDDEEPLLLTEHGELGEDDTDDPTSVKVAADFEDADAEEEEADGEFGVDGVDDDEDMDLDDLESTIDANELKALREEVAEMEGWENEEGTLPTGSRAGRDAQLDLPTLDRITALRAAFPSVTAERCEKLLLKHKDDRKVYRKLATSQQPRIGLENMLAFNTSLHQPSSARDVDEINEGGSDDEVSSVVRHFDQHGFPPGSIAAGNALEHMAQVLKDPHALNAMKLVNKKFDDEVPGKDAMWTRTRATSDSESSSDSDSSSSSEEEEGDEDEEKSDSEKDPPYSDNSSSSESNSDSDSDSDSGPEEAPTRAPRSRSSSSGASDTSSSGSSSSDDEDGSIHSATKKDITGLRHTAASSDEDSSDDSSSDDSSSDGTSSSESESDSDSDSSSAASTPKRITRAVTTGSLRGPASVVPSKDNASATASAHLTPVPPGQGMSKTQRRNARRRAAKQAKRASEINGADSSFQLDEATSGTPEKDTELLARKRALMEQFEASPSQPEVEANQPSVNDDVQPGDTASPSVPADKPDPPTAETPSTTSSQRKMRLDMSAGRRMLFGALGIKNPKTKPDEERIRANLMKGVRPLVNIRIEQNQPDKDAIMTEAAPVSNEDGEDGDWRDKINYRAVECCQEGVELSEPPFPFIQRWDPQQQGRGKGKRKQRNQAQFYQDEDVQHKTKKRKVHQLEEQSFDNSYFEEADASNGDIELNYDDEQSMMDKDRATADSQMTDLDDLPSLPSDLSSLPRLQPGEAVVGMVITWTAWLLSSATGWQPQVSNLTGIVTKIEDDGAMLEVLLARRDRNLDRNEKNYDEETGQRVYDRFEAPDLEEDEADHLESEGYRKLSFSDLGDPRIVQEPLTPARGLKTIEDSQPNAQERGDGLEKSRSQSDHSRTLGRAESEKRLDNGEHVEVDGQVFESIITNTDNGQSSLAVSTQPGQVVSVDSQPQVELRLVPTGAGTDKEVMPSISSQGSNNSPSRQLEDMSEAAYAASLQASSQSSHQPLGESQPLDDPVDQDSQEDHPTASDAMAKVDYPKLNMLSSTDSVHSGRQPDPALSNGPSSESLPKLADTPGESVPPEEHLAPVSQKNIAAAANKAQLQSSPARSDVSNASSIPSLSQVWHPASQAETTNAVPTFSQKMTARVQDEEYEAAMRKLDEASDEESEKESAQRPTKKLPDRSVSDVSTKTQSRLKKEVKTFEESVSPPALPRTRRRRAASPFTVPAGSQVVSLMTSSPEPDYSENYAEASTDKSYGVGKTSLNGGVAQKQRRGVRGVSLPARETTKAYATRRVTASQAPESKAGVRI